MFRLLIFSFKKAQKPHALKLVIILQINPNSMLNYPFQIHLNINQKLVE